MKSFLAFAGFLTAVSCFPAMPGPINSPFGTPSQAIFNQGGLGSQVLYRSASQVPQAQLIPANSEVAAKLTGGKGKCKVYYYCCIFYCWSKWTPCGCYLVCADRGSSQEAIPVDDGKTTNEFFDPPSPTDATPSRADVPSHGGSPDYIAPANDKKKVTDDDRREPEVIENDNHQFSDQDNTEPQYPPVQYEDPYEWQEPYDGPEYAPFDNQDPYETHPYPEEIPYIEEEPFYPDEEQFDDQSDYEGGQDEDDTLIAFGQVQGRRPLMVRFPQSGLSFEARARSANGQKPLSAALGKKLRRVSRRHHARKPVASPNVAVNKQANVDNKFVW